MADGVSRLLGISAAESLLSRKSRGKAVIARNSCLDRFSDMLRKVITPKPTFSEEERGIVYATLTFVAKLSTQNGVNVIIDATGNR